MEGHKEVVGVDDVSAVGILSESELILVLSNSGVLDVTYDTIESLDYGLISIEYSRALPLTFDIKYDGSTVIVTLTGKTVHLIYTISK